MRRFAALYGELDASTSTAAKVEALVRYFAAAPPEDAAWAVYFLAGGRPRQTVPTAMLRTAACRAAGLADWLFEECYQAVGDLAETIARLKAYAQAGADCLYAPGLRTREQIGAVVDAVAPKPVNLLIGWASDLTLADAAALGVRRVSVGGALARAAWGGFQRAARQIAEQGRFDGFADAASGAELNKLFHEDTKRRDGR